MAGPVQKATLQIEDGETLTASSTRRTSASRSPTAGRRRPRPARSAAKPTFGGGQPRELTLQLLFDATLLTPQVSVKDVSAKLFDAMNASKNEGGAQATSRDRRR